MSQRIQRQLRASRRGAAFCQSEHGNAKSFTCPYHHWNYDLKGNITGLPFRRGYKDKGGMPADFNLSLRDGHAAVPNFGRSAGLGLRLPWLRRWVVERRWIYPQLGGLRRS
jgi:hypothetical protein